MHYFIRETSHHQWTVSKFDPDKSGEPLDTYDIVGNYCNCPSPKKPCKHQWMVIKWEALGAPMGMYYDDSVDLFKKSPFDLDVINRKLQKP